MERRHIWYPCFFFILCNTSALKHEMLSPPLLKPQIQAFTLIFGVLYFGWLQWPPRPPITSLPCWNARQSTTSPSKLAHCWPPWSMHTNPSPKPWDGGVKLIRSRNCSGHHYHLKRETKVWSLCNHRLPHPETPKTSIRFWDFDLWSPPPQLCPSSPSTLWRGVGSWPPLPFRCSKHDTEGIHRSPQRP